MQTNMNEAYLTKEGLLELKNELHKLKTVRRREIAELIHTAKEQGDLSENAEYVQAKDEQRRIEEKIAEFEIVVKHARIIGKSSTAQVDIGNLVVLACDGVERKYRIVGSNEASPLEGKISNESPVGRALIGVKKNEQVQIPTPSGEISCTIIDIKNV